MIGLAACAAPQQPEVVQVQVTPVRACAPSGESLILDPDFAPVAAALGEGRWADALVEADARLVAIAGEATTLFHTPPPPPEPVECAPPGDGNLGITATGPADPARSARAAQYRAFLARWVYAEHAVLRLGRDRFLLDESLAQALAVASLALGDDDAARRWLADAGAPWETGAAIDRCWASLVPEHDVERAVRVGAIDLDAVTPVPDGPVVAQRHGALGAPN